MTNTLVEILFDAVQNGILARNAHQLAVAQAETIALRLDQEDPVKCGHCGIALADRNPPSVVDYGPVCGLCITLWQNAYRCPGLKAAHNAWEKDQADKRKIAQSGTANG